MDSKLAIIPGIVGIISVIGAVYCNEMQNQMMTSMIHTTGEANTFVTLSIVLLVVAVICFIAAAVIVIKRDKE